MGYTPSAPVTVQTLEQLSQLPDAVITACNNAGAPLPDRTQKALRLAGTLGMNKLSVAELQGDLNVLKQAPTIAKHPEIMSAIDRIKDAVSDGSLVTALQQFNNKENADRYNAHLVEVAKQMCGGVNKVVDFLGISH